jgi:transcriptional regulator with XRE-family HTH domain
MAISMKEMRARMHANPEVRAEYERLKPEFEIAAELIRARVKAKLSQTDVAERMNTTQSQIARIESGRAALRTSTLHKYADAVGFEAHLKLVRKKPALQESVRRAAAGNKPARRAG